MTQQASGYDAELAPAPARRFGEEVLLDYATGALDAPTALMVAAQAALCPEVARAVAAAEALGGALLEDAAPAPMHEGALDRLFARIDAADDAAQPASQKSPSGQNERAPEGPEAAGRAARAGRLAPPAEEIARLPAPVRARVAACGRRWSFVAPGVRALDLEMTPAAAGPETARAPARGQRKGGEVRLYRIEPGHGVPAHGHHGGEVTLVLTGAFADGRDRYGPGDIAVAGPDITHKPVAEPGAVCYALAITDAPLRLTGALGVVQRLLGGG